MKKFKGEVDEDDMDTFDDDVEDMLGFDEEE